MSERPGGISRRHFFFGTLLAGVVPRAGFGSVPSLKQLGFQSPNEKLNIAGIGSGGRAMSVLGGCDSENIVALADVDWVRGAEGFKRWEKATRYKDFRQMLDKQGKGIDAVTVVIPDHMHTHAALTAMQLGKHVYVEKPLTRTPWEARLLTDAAAKYKVATQMGNQGYSHDATRVASEIIWSGEIGNVTEVFAFRGNAGWPQGMTSLPPAEKVPDTLDWDLWLGTAAWRDYTSGDDAWRKQYDESQYRFLSAVQLAWVLRLRHEPHWRLGHSHPRPCELGVATRQPDQRRVHEARRRQESLHVSARRRRRAVGLPGARQHAAGLRALVGYRRRVPPSGHDRRTGATNSGHRTDDRQRGGWWRRRARTRSCGTAAATGQRLRVVRQTDPAAQAGRGGGRGGRGGGGGVPSRASATTRSSSGRKGSSARAVAAKASACSPVSGGQTINCRRRC